MWRLSFCEVDMWAACGPLPYPYPSILRGARGALRRYPPGARRAMVVLRGKDSQFWAGNYGAKFASPSLAFAGAPLGAAEQAAVDAAADAAAAQA